MDPMTMSMLAGNAQDKSKPYIEAARVGVDLITFFMNRADQKKAQKEAQAIDARNFAYGQERDAFSEDMQKKNFALNKRQVAFGEQQTNMKNVKGVTDDFLDRLASTINGNEALKNTVIGRWGA